MAVEPIPSTTRIVTLAARPSGRPTPANFALEEQPVGELGAGPAAGAQHLHERRSGHARAHGADGEALHH